MPTIFPGSASVGQVFDGYTFDGTAWNINGIDLNTNYLEESSASATYLTQVNASSTYQPIVANVSNTEIGYLDGVTSSIQNQIDAKLASSTASSTYLTQASASTTYLTQASASTNYALKASPTFTGTVTVPSIFLTSAVDATTSSTGNAIQIGSSTSTNVVFDENEIQARNNGATSTLILNQSGGGVSINSTAGAAGTTTIGNATGSNALVVNGTISSTSEIRADSGGADGGLVMRPWTGNSIYESIATNGMAGNEYIFLSGGTTTYISAGASSDVIIRPNANANANELIIDTNGAHSLKGTFDVTSTLTGGNIISDAFLGSVGKSAATIANQGLGFGSSSSNSIVTATGNAAFYAQRLEDGSIIAIVSGTSTEGTISVSGTTTTYAAFCGAHWSQFEGISRPDILPGTVLENIDEMCEWWDEEDIKLPNDQLARVKVSDTLESKAVYGVFQRYDDEEGGVNDIMVASIGAWLCRIQPGEILQIGDLLDSAGNGCAKVQDDDIIRSRTIAKVTSTIPYTTYEDGSFVVPVTLHCG